MLAFIRYLSLSTLRWVCQGFKHFPGFLQHFVMAKLATSSMRFKSYYWNCRMDLSIILTITWKLGIILQNIWRRVGCSIAVNISHWKIFLAYCSCMMPNAMVCSKIIPGIILHTSIKNALKGSESTFKVCSGRFKHWQNIIMCPLTMKTVFPMGSEILCVRWKYPLICLQQKPNSLNYAYLLYPILREGLRSGIQLCNSFWG